jgi:hypothetical protein
MAGSATHEKKISISMLDEIDIYPDTTEVALALIQNISRMVGPYGFDISSLSVSTRPNMSQYL